LLLTVFLPCGKHHSPAQLFVANRFLPNKVLFSIKNIKIKSCEAKHSGKKDFIFAHIVVNQLFL